MTLTLPSSARGILATVEQYETGKNFLKPIGFQENHYLRAQVENRLLLKIDFRVIPVTTLFIFLSLLDQENIFTPEFDKMRNNIHLEGSQFNHCVMICLVTYCVCAIPSSLGLIKATPAFWLPTIISCWGVVMTTMGIIHDFAGLFWSRFFLGVFESGMLPGVYFVTSTWYRKNELQFRQSMILSIAVSVNGLAGILTWTISKMRGVGGMEGWRWIFVIEGCLSVIAGGFGYMLMFNYPDSSEILTDKERRLNMNRVLASEGWWIDEIDEEDDNDLLVEENEVMSYFKTYKMWGLEAAFLDWQVYVHTLIYLAISTGSYSVNILLPHVLQAMNLDEDKTKLVSIPVYLGSSICSVFLGLASDKIASRFPVLFLSFAMIIAGFIVIMISEVRDTRGSVAYSGLFLASVGVQTAGPGAVTWICNNTLTQPKRVFAVAIQIGCGSLGGIIATYLYINSSTPKSLVHVMMIIIASLGLILVIFSALVYSRINTRRARLCYSGAYERPTNLELAIIGDKHPFFRYMI